MYKKPGLKTKFNKKEQHKLAEADFVLDKLLDKLDTKKLPSAKDQLKDV